MITGSYEELASAIKDNDNFVISGHINADGDVIGSAFGLFLILRSLGKTVRISLDPPVVPKKYAFAQSTDVFGVNKIGEFEVFIALECPMPKRLGALQDIALNSKILINMDHHGDNQFYGTVDFVDPEAASTTEIIYKLCSYLDAAITPEIANDLYIGLVTDTGKFQYSNTTEETLRIASELVAKGADPNNIFQSIYENISYGALLQLGRMAVNAKIEDDVFIWSYIDKNAGGVTVDPGETENLIDHLRAVSGPEVSALLKIDESDIKGSLRSRGKVNVSLIAEKFNGGGHPNAAGFSAQMPMQEIVDKIKGLIKEALK